MVRHEPVDEDDGEEKTRSRRTEDKQGNQRGDAVADVLDQVKLWTLFICNLELTTLCSGSRL